MEIRGQVVPPTLLKIVVACALAIGTLVGFGTWKYLTDGNPITFSSTTNSRAWVPGAEEVANTRKALGEASEALQRFDKKGDAKGATGMLSGASSLLRNIDAAPFQSEAMRNCQLAAAHLADGVLSVSQGGTWLEQSRFKTALADCI